MKISTLRLVCLLLSFSSSGFGEVLIYSGSVKEMRPGSRQKASRALLVVETDIFGPPAIALLAPGVGAGRWVFPYSRTEIIDRVSPSGASATRGGFLLVRGKLTVEGRSETTLHLTSNYSKNTALLYHRPRTFSGRLTAIQQAVFVVFVIIDGEPPTSAQGADMSELSLVFSLDARRTIAAQKARRTFDHIVYQRFDGAN